MSPESHVFFLDRDLGNKSLRAELQRAGLRVEIHKDHFKEDEKDTIWVPEVGRRGWVLLTKDKHMRTRVLERNALIQAKVAAFFLSSGDMRAFEMCSAFVHAIARMLHILACTPRPFMARVSRGGHVELIYPMRP